MGVESSRGGKNKQLKMGKEHLWPGDRLNPHKLASRKDLLSCKRQVVFILLICLAVWARGPVCAMVGFWTH